MKEIQFNINEKPKTYEAQAAYLVDKSNVDLIAQYVKKYYPQTPLYWDTSCIKWYNKIIADKIHQRPDAKYFIYFCENELSWDYYNDEATAFAYKFDIYHIVPQPTVMTLE